MLSRNPFQFSGHFNKLDMLELISRSIRVAIPLIFRAFQHSTKSANSILSVSRNPFHYLGHFNKEEGTKQVKEFSLEGLLQSLPLFRAFQLTL